MNDYENISTLESNSYKSLGQLNEDSVIATSELSNAISTICYNLSNMLDKRDENSTISGNVEISGSLSANGSFVHDSGTFSINPQDGTKGFFIRDKSFADYLSSLSDDLDAQIERKLDKYDGGIVSNDVAVYQHDMKILSGNYVQTTTPLSVYNYSNSNGFIQAEATKSYGSASIGSRGFIVLGVTSAENKVVLSVDGTPISDIIPESCYAVAWSIALDNYLDAQFSEISAVGTDYVIFKNPLQATAVTNGKSKEYFKGLIKDDNALYCPTHPEIGNCVIPTFTSNHAEGGSTHATAQFAHAEGRYTFAEGRYSHAEGHNAIAAGTAAHAEGMFTKALANKGAHAEGLSSITNGEAAHAEGYQASAYAVYSHAEGYQTKADGRESHAEGYLAIATGTGSHAEGSNTLALSDYAHVEGVSCIASGIAAHSEGYQTSVFNENAAHAEGAYTKAGGNSSHAEGYYSVTQNRASHAEGYQTSAIAQAAHAEGVQSEANGSGAHAEGGAVLGATPYKGGTAKGAGSHAGGYKTLAKGNWSYAGGEQTSAIGRCTFAIGDHAQALSDNMFVWNGVKDSAYPVNDNASIGTFCVNPVDGLSGFYIGNKNLASCLNEICSAISNSMSDISDDLSNYLDKRDERNVVSGGIEIMQHSLSVISGNYIQTSTPLSTNNYSAANGFMQAESIKYGDPSIGSKAYCILSVMVPEKAIVISGDFGYSNVASKQYPTQDSSKTFRNGLGNESVSLTLKYSLINASNTNPCLSDLMWSLALFNIGDTNFGHLTTIEQTTIEGIQSTKLQFDKLPANIGQAIAGKSLAEYINDFTDVNGDNALYVRGFVELGNQIPLQFTSQYAAGGAIRAIGKYTHAEGRDTIADGRYSHVEGTATIAGGVASHAEGQSTHATGRSSHSEGEGTRAQAEISHAEGYQAIATGTCSHAEGGYWLSSGYSGNYAGGTASGSGSHAEGRKTYASGDASHSEGYQTSAYGIYSHAEGYNSKASGVGAHAEGGYWLSSGYSGNYAGGTASGSGSHAEGYQTSAIGEASHAEGCESNAVSVYSHAEGYQTSAFGNYSHAEGYRTYTNGQAAHAEGGYTSAIGNYSYASGFQSKTNSIRQWVWNGDSSKIYTAISGEGTFCINPKGGLSSFYIGKNSLCSLIQNATSGGNAVQSTIVNALRDIGLSANTLSSDIDAGQVLQFMSKLTQLLA